MEIIIQHILADAATIFLDYFQSNGISSLDKMADDLKLISDGMAARMLGAFIDAADESICDAKKERKEDGIKVHEHGVPRTLFTSLGFFTYNRTYFDCDTPAGRAYLLDDILGVDPYERVDAGVSARLVNAAATHSYARSAAIAAGGNVSRQSSWNKAMNTGEVAYVPERADYIPEAIHIFADEDHVPLQDGSGTVVSLVTVCAGKRHVCKGRNELVDPFHVQGYGMDKETLWDYVYALCAEKFDLDRVGTVYVYGDGASWIRGSLDVFPNAVYVLDTFHFKKRMRSLFSGEVGAQFTLAAHTAVTKGDKVAFKATAQALMTAVLDTMPEGRAREKKAENINDNIGYILNNWDAIQNAKLPGAIGSCTEALVSHVLSDRLSRSPMGWSKKGLSKMAMIRVFALNGGEVTPTDTLAWKHCDRRFRVSNRIEKYENIVWLQQEEVLKDAKNWRWFEVDSKISRKTTGTKIALDALGKLRNVS